MLFHFDRLICSARVNIAFDVLQDNIRAIPRRYAHKNNFDRCLLTSFLPIIASEAEHFADFIATPWLKERFDKTATGEPSRTPGDDWKALPRHRWSAPEERAADNGGRERDGFLVYRKVNPSR